MMEADLKHHDGGKMENFNEREKKLPSLEEFAQGTSLHGLKNTLNNKYTGPRIVWRVLFLALIIICIALLAITINRYFQYESVSSYTRTFGHEIEFPSVTICRLSTFDRESLYDFDLYMNYIRMVHNPLSELHTNETLRNWYMTELKKVTIDEFFDRVAFDLNETVMSCKFGPQENKDCYSYFTPFYTEIGKCFTFNSQDCIMKHGPLKCTSSGPSFGLEILLDAKDESGSIPPDHLGSGFLFLVHDPTVYPQVHRKSFLISPGQETYISLTKHINKRLSTPYSLSECLDVSKPEHQNYSQELCQYVCMQEMVWGGSCYIYGGDQNKPCTLYDGVESGFTGFGALSSDECNSCLPACENTIFDYTVTSSVLSQKTVLANVHNWPQNVSYSLENFAQVWIYFDSLEYTVTEQKVTLTYQMVLSDIGGLLGICLGASIVTLAEVMEYAILIAYRKCKNRDKKKTLVVPIHFN